MTGASPDLTQRLADWPDPMTVYGFPRWKWRYVRRCLPNRRLDFVGAGAPAPRAGGLLLWGMAALPENTPPGLPVARMEDGFLRSVGLGAELTRPLSWVIDRHGIYYDSTRPSDLEILLQAGGMSDALRARAAALLEAVLLAGLTKYNLTGAPWRRPAGSRPVVLVPGQVESDASLALGAPGLRTNIGLLRAVRAARPDAHLLYKPHPDVVARLRREGAGEPQAASIADEVITDAPMHGLLEAVDEVHVLTSLAGFEALLRGRRVVCHGQPFYAGWGLTQDMIPVPRRTRRLGLDELVAGALIAYPLYIGAAAPIPPEAALGELAAWKARDAGRARPFQELYRMLLRRCIGVR
jgi:capsular polysaccharide export protein